jgi:dihydroorotate dehydrogenase
MPRAALTLDAAYALARPALFRMDAERAHELVLGLLSTASAAPPGPKVMRRLLGADDPRHAVEAFGLRFPNPIGLAAGLDKNALALPAWAALGFGHVEIGTVTPAAQSGNPRPRVFRLPSDRALVNRMGFPNDGADMVAQRLACRPHDLPIIVGGNVGKGYATPISHAVEDYRRAAQVVFPHVDYVAVNVSSPNTPGLRQLQAPEEVSRILEALRPLGRKPVLLKLAPDLEPGALSEIVAAAREAGAAGFIATNTTTERAGLVHPSAVAREPGGLSGAPLRAKAVAFTVRLAELAGPDLPIIGVGGIFTAADVRERLAAGARLVQVYTALVYEGPGLVAKLLPPCA